MGTVFTRGHRIPTPVLQHPSIPPLASCGTSEVEECGEEAGSTVAGVP